LPLRPALAQAQKLGTSGVELAAAGPLAPRQLSQTGRRELRQLCKSHDLQLIALACPLRKGLDVADNQEARIDYLKDCLALAYDLGPGKAVVQAGRVPEKEDNPRAPLLREALAELGRHGDRVGGQLLLETGAEPGEILAAYLARFDTGSLGACFNPGSLLQNGHDPIAAARALHRFVGHAHATDARQVNPSRTQAVPLGHGDIDWTQLLGVLEEIGYHGWLSISEAQGAAEAAAALGFLTKLAGIVP
jgi:sugar phosphate isomerase/epimerase